MSNKRLTGKKRKHKHGRGTNANKKRKLNNDNTIFNPKANDTNVTWKEARKRAWFLTWNNHTETSINILLSIPGIKEYRIQEESGEKEETPHLQGVIHFNDAKTWSQLRKKAEIFWEPAKNIFACKNYCSKQETSTGKSWQKGFGLKFKVKDPLDGKTLFPWQKELMKFINGPTDDRRIFWYWSIRGNVGKSAFAKHLCLKHDATFVGGKHADAFHAIGKRVNEEEKDVYLVIYDLPRCQGNIISYKGLECIKNGHFFTGKYDSGSVIFNIPKLIVFANEAPDETSMSTDRWHIRQIDAEESINIGPTNQYQSN